MEGTMSYYVILRHTRTVQSMSHNGGGWVIVERSGRFWVMVHGKEKRKKINEVRHLAKYGHNTPDEPESEEDEADQV